MLKIEIKEQALTGRTWQDGKPVFEQVAWAYIPERNGNAPDYPQRVVLRLANGSQPYPVGLYRLPPSNFYVGNFSALTVGQAVLVPLAQAVNNTQKQAA